ncbi:cytochrome P450 [Lentzea roselyniae]
MVRSAHSRADSWQEDETLDFLREMNEMTLSITIDTLMRTELSQDARDQVLRATPAVLQGLLTEVMYPTWMPKWVPLPGHRTFHRGSRELRDVFQHVIASYRATDGGEGDDIFSLMCRANDEETNYRMDDEQVKDEAVSFPLASTETTASALAWACYRLAKDPVLQQRVRDEAFAVLGDRDVEMADFNQLTFTDQVISEALRLYAPAWVVMRRAIVDTHLGPYHVPKGTEIIFAPTAMHRDPDLYKDPLNFNPDRWHNVRPSALKEAYLPFGAGRRKCIGDGFARFEMTTAITTFVRKLHLELAEDANVETKLFANLQPRGLKMRVRALVPA